MNQTSLNSDQTRIERELSWEGFYNTRDLGGLLTADGRLTRRLAIVRSAAPWQATMGGWRSIHAAGIRTIVDLRNDDEISLESVPIDDITTVRVAIDDVDDVAFWQYIDDNRLDGTPLYFRPFLEAKPERCAAAVVAVARAEPGGVLFHCGVGRDRTGLLALLLLALVGVPPETIAEDYELSMRGTARLFSAMGRPDENPIILRILADRGTTMRKAVVDACTGFDPEAYLLAAGVSPADINAIRQRLL